MRAHLSRSGVWFGCRGARRGSHLLRPAQPRHHHSMGRLKQIVIDCATPSALARFWAAALDDFEVRPYDDEEVARLAALGHTPETDPSVIVDGPHVELCFQKVDVERTSKTPLHLDLTASEWLA